MVASTKPKPDVARAEAAIAKLAQAFPGVTEENPWGHRAFKVRGKTFLFLDADVSGVSFSVKLPESGVAALALDFTEPTHYGLGKSGWVTARFARERDVPLPLVREWLDESYRAIAPAKLSATLAGSTQKPRATVSRARPTKQATPPVAARAKTRARPRAKARTPRP
jgi:predicted DNA-binding protein (MmcQ/YjbR family)